MPRATRNFWIELEMDGRLQKIETGPRGKDGGFLLMIRMREKGKVSNRFIRISGQPDVEGGRLELKAEVVSPEMEIEENFRVCTVR